MASYKSTAVPVERSHSHIRELLLRYGAKGVQFTDDFAESSVQMRFRYDVESDEKSLVYMVRIDAKVAVAKRKETQAQNLRATWRAVYWALKSRMESIDYGIETFEQAFLAHFEAGIDESGNSVTIGEKLIPRLRAGQLALAPPKEE